MEQSLGTQDRPPPPSRSGDHTHSGEAEAKSSSSEHEPEHEKAISEGSLDVDRVPATAEGGSHRSRGESSSSAQNGQAGVVKDESVADREQTLVSVTTEQRTVPDEITQKAEGSEEQPVEGETPTAVEVLTSSAAEVGVLGSKSEPKLVTGKAKEDDDLKSQSVAVIVETKAREGMPQTESEGGKNTEGLKSASSTSLTKAKRSSSPSKSRSGESLKSSSQTHLKLSSTTQLIGTKSHESAKFGSSAKLSRSRESLKVASQVYSSKSRESLKKLDPWSKLSSKSRESLKNSDGKKKTEPNPQWVKDEKKTTNHREKTGTSPKESKSVAAETPPTASGSAEEAEEQPRLGGQEPAAEQPVKETVSEARLEGGDSKPEQHKEGSSAGGQDSSELQPIQERSMKQLAGDEQPLVVDARAEEEARGEELPAQKPETEPTRKHSCEGLATSKEGVKSEGDAGEGRPADGMDKSEPPMSDSRETEVGKREGTPDERSELQGKSGESKAARSENTQSHGDASGSKSSLRGSRVKLISVKPGGSGSNSRPESVPETSKEKGEMTSLSEGTEVKEALEKQGIDKRTGQSESSIVEAVEKLNVEASEPQAAEPPTAGEVTASA